MNKSVKRILDAAPARHRAALLALLERLSVDPCILRVRLGGSLSRCEGDPFSDIDLTIDVDPDAFEAVFTRRHQYLEAIAPVLMEPGFWVMQSGLPMGAEAWTSPLLADGTHLDVTYRRGCWSTDHGGGVLLYGSQEEGAVPETATSFSFDKDPLAGSLEWFWGGCSLCAGYIGRGDLWSAHFFMETRRSLIIDMWREVHRPEHKGWGHHALRADLPAPVQERLAASVTRLEAGAMKAGLRSLMDFMAEEGPELFRAYQHDLSYPAEVVAQVRQIAERRMAAVS